CCSAGRAYRIAGTRTVEGNQPKTRQHRKYRVAEVMQLPAEPVDEDDRASLTRRDIVDAVAADVDEPARCRHHALGFCRDAARRHDEVAGNESEKQKDGADYPTDNASHDDPHMILRADYCTDPKT